MRKNVERGHAEAVIVIVIVIVILCGLGWVLWKNIISKTDDSPKANDSATTDYHITRGSGDMDTYTNKTLGFSFDFPKQTQGTVGCEKTPLTVDDTEVDGVANYDTTRGAADMTVLSGDHRFTITQKQAPLLTTGKYGDGDTANFYNKDCKVVSVTHSLIDEALKYTGGEDGERILSVEARSFMVKKLSSESELATAWKTIEGIPVDTIKSATYTVKATDSTDRKEVTYEYNMGGEEAGPDSFLPTLVWYFPEQKLFVSYVYGQSMPFLYLNDDNKSYTDAILASFTTL